MLRDHRNNHDNHHGCTDHDGIPGPPRAFVAGPGQGVNLLRGVWHGVLTPLGTSGLFVVVDRIGSGPNCDVHVYPRPYLVEAAQ